jgi:hypothetical protein
LLPAEAWTLTLLVVLTVLTIVVGLGVAETVPVPVLLGAALIVTGDVGFWVVVVTVFALEVGAALP